MFRKKGMWLGMVFFILLIVLSFTIMAVSAEPIILRYSDSDPPGGMRTDFLKNVWFPEIEKQTNGQVKIQDFWGGALLGPAEALQGCKDGITDMTLVFTNFYLKQFPLFQLFNYIPKGPQKWENLHWVYYKAFEEIPQFLEVLEEDYNQKLLLITAGLPSSFSSTYPLDNGVRDIKGYKWRASTQIHLKLLENVGATPISVPWPDVYMALQTGIIDGVYTNYDGAHMMKFYEIAPYIIVIPQMTGIPYLHTINLDVWNSLPEDVQEGIMKASRIAEEKFGEIFSGELEKTIQENLEEGCTVEMIDEDDLDYFLDDGLLNNLRNKLIQDLKEDYNLENSAYIVEIMKLILDEGTAREQ